MKAHPVQDLQLLRCFTHTPRSSGAFEAPTDEMKVKVKEMKVKVKEKWR